MDDSESLDEINEKLKKLTEERQNILSKASERSANNEKSIRSRLFDIDKQINELMQKRKKKLQKKYTRPVIEPNANPGKPRVPLYVPGTRPKLAKKKSDPEKTAIKMVPDWFEGDDEQKALEGIVYPQDTTDRRPFDMIARYRALIGQSNDFRRHKLKVDDNSTETIILMLDAFAQQFGGELTFTNDHLSFDDSVHRTACGVANLGGTHLLAGNYVPSAGFTFTFNRDYDKDLTATDDAMDDFIVEFAADLATHLNCPIEYIRVLSVERNPDGSPTSIVRFGLTCPDQSETQNLADSLRSSAQKGFTTGSTLKYLKTGDYPYHWIPTLSYLQLRPSDFAPEHNMDYQGGKFRKTMMRGNYPYHLPLGWFRHALRIDGKYSGDDAWLKSDNKPGEWPVAYHGTHTNSASSFTGNSLFVSSDETDTGRQEAIQQKGSAFDRPGIYLTTHCDGGAHPLYTKTYSLPLIEGHIRKFLLVFMCRVHPEEFTVHRNSVPIGDAWRLVNPDAIRPYGILVKNDD